MAYICALWNTSCGWITSCNAGPWSSIKSYFFNPEYHILPAPIELKMNRLPRIRGCSKWGKYGWFALFFQCRVTWPAVSVCVFYWVCWFNFFTESVCRLRQYRVENQSQYGAWYAVGTLCMHTTGSGPPASAQLRHLITLYHTGTTSLPCCNSVMNRLCWNITGYSPVASSTKDLFCASRHVPKM